jgi:hypothetical protein
MPTARLLLPLILLTVAPGCALFQPLKSKPAAAPTVALVEPLAPSPRLILGRVLAVNREQGFVFVDLAADAPAAALAEGTEFICRTLEPRETGRVRASRYVRGRTLGTTLVAGQPSLGDEVVWLAP